MNHAPILSRTSSGARRAQVVALVVLSLAVSLLAAAPEAAQAFKSVERATAADAWRPSSGCSA